MRFGRRRLSRKPFLCFSGHWRQDTAHDKGPGLICPVCCVTGKDPRPLGWKYLGLEGLFFDVSAGIISTSGLHEHGAERDTLNGVSELVVPDFSCRLRLAGDLSSLRCLSVCVRDRKSAERANWCVRPAWGVMPIIGREGLGWVVKPSPFWGFGGAACGTEQACDGCCGVQSGRVQLSVSSPSQQLVWRRVVHASSHDRHRQKHLM